MSSYPDMNNSLTEEGHTTLVWKVCCQAVSNYIMSDSSFCQDWVHELTGEEEDLPVYKYEDMPPLYNKLDTPSPKTPTFAIGSDNTATGHTEGHVSPWSLTPRTAQFVLDYLSANPPPSYENYEGYVDPNVLQKGSTYGGDSHDDAAAIHEAAYGQAWDDVSFDKHVCYHLSLKLYHKSRIQCV
jgi:hypothetical protein